ncbi:transcriptional regulator [Candidatus Bathyarchaeota archaeon]|nr:MAG: transcriptional regulator [Candidatus Bathyarchaeota archaeon]
MVSKDQAIGGVIFLVCIIVALFYVATLFYPQWLGNLIGADIAAIQFWLVAIPVFLAFVVVLGIGAWIGWTMATTPPPKPIEEIELEENTEKEEKTEEEPKKKQ